MFYFSRCSFGILLLVCNSNIHWVTHQQTTTFSSNFKILLPFSPPKPHKKPHTPVWYVSTSFSTRKSPKKTSNVSLIHRTCPFNHILFYGAQIMVPKHPPDHPCELHQIQCCSCRALNKRKQARFWLHTVVLYDPLVSTVLVCLIFILVLFYCPWC